MVHLIDFLKYRRMYSKFIANSVELKDDLLAVQYSFDWLKSKESIKVWSDLHYEWMITFIFSKCCEVGYNPSMLNMLLQHKSISGKTFYTAVKFLNSKGIITDKDLSDAVSKIKAREVAQ